MIFRSGEGREARLARDATAAPDRTFLLPEAGHILPPQTQRILDYLKADR